MSTVSIYDIQQHHQVKNAKLKKALTQPHLLLRVPLHGLQDDVQGLRVLLAGAVAEDAEEVVEDALQDAGAVEVAAAGDEDLALVTVARYLKREQTVEEEQNTIF